MVAVRTRCHRSAASGSVCQVLAPLSDSLSLDSGCLSLWKQDVVKPALCCLCPTSQPLSPLQTACRPLSPRHLRAGPGFPPQLRASHEQAVFISLIFTRAVQAAEAAPREVHAGLPRRPLEKPPRDTGPTPAGEGAALQDAQTGPEGGSAAQGTWTHVPSLWSVYCPHRRCFSLSPVCPHVSILSPAGGLERGGPDAGPPTWPFRKGPAEETFLHHCPLCKVPVLVSPPRSRPGDSQGG